MATLVVQDDDGSETAANTYISEADADAYFADRNWGTSSLAQTWDDATSANKIVALINSWQYIDNWFTFLGCRLTEDQNTEWPRSGVYSECGKYLIEGIPTDLTYAQCEYAVRALSGPLVPDITYDSNKTITKLKQKVGPIETDTTYGGNGYITSRVYPEADALLNQYLQSTGTLVRG